MRIHREILAGVVEEFNSEDEAARETALAVRDEIALRKRKPSEEQAKAARASARASARELYVERNG